MRYFTALIFALLITACTSTDSQTPQSETNENRVVELSAEQLTVKAVHSKFLLALKNNKIEEVVALFYFSSDSVRKSAVKALSLHQGKYNSVILNSEYVTCRVVDNYALIITQCNESFNFLFLEKIAGSWLLLFDDKTSDHEIDNILVSWSNDKCLKLSRTSGHKPLKERMTKDRGEIKNILAQSMKYTRLGDIERVSEFVHFYTEEERQLYNFKMLRSKKKGEKIYTTYYCSKIVGDYASAIVLASELKSKRSKFQEVRLKRFDGKWKAFYEGPIKALTFWGKAEKKRIRQAK